jgi:membrane-bound serine protease (ClpP class)
MRIVVFLLALIAGLAGLAGGHAATDRQAMLLDISGPIGPATSDYVSRGLAAAQEQDVRIVILRLDTPGGLDTSMRVIIEDILASPVPVVSYVAPSGARAASAGTYILYASHVAAMAPGTNLGAATPVQLGGGGGPTGGGEDQQTGGGEDGEEGAGGDRPTIEDKAINDAIAYIRSLAELRGRNAEWAARAVREAASLPAHEAVEMNVVDLMADDLDALLARIDGRTVSAAGRDVKLDTEGLTVVEREPDWRTELLSIITNPNVAYILMLIGIYGIIFEFYSPGLVFPGVIGAVSLLLALYAMHVLPVDYTGLALILLGIALMVGEAFSPGIGAVGIGGVVAFVLGSVLLMDTDVPGYEVSWALITPVALAAAASFLLIAMMAMRSRHRPIVSGPEEMVGSAGRVLDWHDGQGSVRAHGEVWRARAEAALRPGQAVRVRRRDGLVLEVEPDDDPSPRQEVRHG